jgi:hypothetical protein
LDVAAEIRDPPRSFVRLLDGNFLIFIAACKRKF